MPTPLLDNLQGKKILLAVSGSIAAYKSAFLTRLLVRNGAEVQVLMTPAATGFISPLTLSTLSRRPVHSDVHAGDSWNNHVELGLWADAMVVAPATAVTLAKLAQGISDNVVVATYLSARCPVFFAPAMDLDMWAHPATRRHVKQLQADGNHLIQVGKGELASGLEGEGRMAEPEAIAALLDGFFSAAQRFRSKRILITAGPTYEPIDPVRFVGNWSSGKMGVALALAAARQGARVDLVLGPSALDPVHPLLQVHRVRTAREMHAAALAVFPDSDAAILAAAVADYRPETEYAQKLKKNTDDLQLRLVKNPDIAADLGRRKHPGQVVVGFALETERGPENAREKMQRKNLDLIVLNTLGDAGVGFHHETNRVTLLYADNKREDFELKSKREVAEDILNALARLLPEPK